MIKVLPAGRHGVFYISFGSGSLLFNCEGDALMAEEQKPGCARPTGGPVGEEAPAENKQTMQPEKKEQPRMIMVGRKAPDFSAPAYHKGQFTSVKLSDYLGKWVTLCFYPGDFTFV